MSDDFWAAIRVQLMELTSAKTAADVVRILSKERNPYGDPTMCSGDGFFAGSGGDDTVADALRQAGWGYAWRKAGYHYCMKAPNGSAITYVEGDIYIGDERTP